MANLHESTCSKIESFTAKRGELKTHLHHEIGKVEELEHNTAIWARRQANTLKTVIAKYV